MTTGELIHVYLPQSEREIEIEKKERIVQIELLYIV